MIVDPEATEGTNKFKVRVSPNGKDEWEEVEFNIDVQTEDATIGVDSITTIPAKLEPGKEALVKIKVKNMADSFLKDISVKLDLYVEETATTTTATDYPFAPLGSTGQKFLKSLSSGETAEFMFNIITLPNTESGVYKIPVLISYKDNLGTNFSTTDVTGFIVEGKPELVVSVESSTVYSDAHVGKIVLKFVNKGLGDIKFLDIKLKDNTEFDIVSSTDREYIGNLDSDDYDTVEFTISASGGGEITLPVLVEYKDASNNEYSEEYPVPLKIISKQQAGVQQSSAGLVIVIVIILAVIAFFVIRGIRKKKKKSKK